MLFHDAIIQIINSSLIVLQNTHHKCFYHVDIAW